MIAAADIYEDFLHDLFHQETATVTPSEFNRLAKNAIAMWIEEIRAHYDKHEMLLDDASTLVETISPTAANNKVELPNKDTLYAYLLRVEFVTNKCIPVQVGIEKRRNNATNYYDKQSSYEVFYKLEGIYLVPEITDFTVSAANVTVLKYPNIFSVDDNGAGVLDSNLSQISVEKIIKLMLQLYKAQHTN